MCVHKVSAKKHTNAYVFCHMENFQKLMESWSDIPPLNSKKMSALGWIRCIIILTVFISYTLKHLDLSKRNLTWLEINILCIELTEDIQELWELISTAFFASKEVQNFFFIKRSHLDFFSFIFLNNIGSTWGSRPRAWLNG